MRQIAACLLFRMKDLLSKTPFQGDIYRICKAYVDFCNGQNNSNISTNGEFCLLKRVLPSCNMVFDVGANVGNWAELALSINPKIHLHCFEPFLQAFNILSKKQLSADVFLNPFGLCREDSIKTLYYYPSNTRLSSLYLREGIEHVLSPKNRKGEYVQLRTIDGYCTERGIRNIDFMKIDVEGNELNVLTGGQKAFKNRWIKHIQFEYGGANIDSRVFLKDILGVLWSYGYCVYKIYPDRLEHITQYSQRLDNFQYQNWFATCEKFGGDTNCVYFK